MLKSLRALLIGSAAAVCGVTNVSGSASAQTAPPQVSPSDATADARAAGSDDIIVTARRRGEESLQVPVVISAFEGQQLSQRGVNSITDISRLVPAFSVETTIASYGGFSTLRGVTSPSSSTTAQPAILTVVDNIPISLGAITRLGQFDLGTVQILKGPQALYFGKNASGGIIALTSAEPSHQFETMLSGEYEFNAREYQLNGVVSGPITDSLLGRFAIKGLTQRGYFFNQAPGVAEPYGPNPKEIAMRGTLVYSPSSSLTIKLKATYDHVKDSGTYYGTQRFFCPTGVPAGATVPGITDCKLDKYFQKADLRPNLNTLFNDPLFPSDGAPYSKLRQILVSLDVNYNISPTVALNAITGYYNLETRYADNIVRGLPTQNFTASDDARVFTQEIRLSSDVKSALTWMVGGFYQNDKLYDTEHVVLYAPATGVLTNRDRAFWHVNGETFSAFAQASFEIVKSLTLSGGARYTDEKKTQNVNLSTKFLPEVSFKNLSPEATVSYRPTNDLNVYASYKRGYKSGTFQVGSLNFAALITNPAITVINNSYKQETVRGFEGGIKAALFNRQLRVDFAAYNYEYLGLQLSSFDPTVNIVRITNAGAARVKGAEASISYAPAGVRGLKLTSAIAYNDARYKNFVGACYVGQTIAQGCTITPAGAAKPSMQNFNNHRLLRAPRWSGNFAVSYDTTVGSDLKFGFNADVSYQSNYDLAQEAAPWGIAPDRALLGASARIGSANGSWEVALIGKNLTNYYYPVYGIQEPGTGSAASTGTTVGLPADYNAVTSRGREVRLRLTIRPNLFR